MQQLAALLAVSPTETLDQLSQAYDDSLKSDQYKHRHRSDVLTTSKCLSVSPPSNRRAASDTGSAAGPAANSSFSIDNILSSSPPRRRCHGDERQHQQPDNFHPFHHPHHHRHHDQLSRRSSDGETGVRSDANDDSSSLNVLQSLPSLPLSQAFYGRSPYRPNHNCNKR